MESKRFKATLWNLHKLVRQYGGFQNLDQPFIILRIMEDMEWLFRDLSDNDLSYTRDYLNSLKPNS